MSHDAAGDARQGVSVPACASERSAAEGDAVRGPHGGGGSHRWATRRADGARTAAAADLEPPLPVVMSPPRRASRHEDLAQFASRLLDVRIEAGELLARQHVETDHGAEALEAR